MLVDYMFCYGYRFGGVGGGLRGVMSGFLGVLILGGRKCFGSWG